MYPIRSCKKIWNIPMLKFHTCSEECKYIYNGFRRKKNKNFKDGKCNQNDKIEKELIQLSAFNKYKDFMYNDNILIKDSTFYILINFPLSKELIFKIIGSDKNIQAINIKVIDIINILKIIYKLIYEVEELTTEEKEHTIHKDCDCILKSSEEFLVDATNINDENCSICFCELKEGSTSKLGCNHEFHKECIIRWIEFNDNMTCPLCRYKLCDKCNNTKYIIITERFKVIPKYLRSPPYLRNETNGYFGINSYDFDELLIESLTYNYENKILEVFIMDYKSSIIF